MLNKFRGIAVVILGFFVCSGAFAIAGEGWHTIGEELAAKYTSLRAKAIETADIKDIKAYVDFQHSLIDLSKKVELLLERKPGIQGIDGKTYLKILDSQLESDRFSFRKEMENKKEVYYVE